MSSKTSQRRAIAAERRQKALEFRRAGLSFEGIAKQLGISRSQAHRLVTQAMEEIAKEAAHEAELLRALELDRLDRLLLGLWQKATAGNVAHVDRALKVMERRAKLTGLDAPTKIAPTDPEGETPYRGMTEEELDQRIQELNAKLGGPDPEAP